MFRKLSPRKWGGSKGSPDGQSKSTESKGLAERASDLFQRSPSHRPRPTPSPTAGSTLTVPPRSPSASHTAHETKPEESTQFPNPAERKAAHGLILLRSNQIPFTFKGFKKQGRSPRSKGRVSHSPVHGDPGGWEADISPSHSANTAAPEEPGRNLLRVASLHVGHESRSLSNFDDETAERNFFGQSDDQQVHDVGEREDAQPFTNPSISVTMYGSEQPREGESPPSISSSPLLARALRRADETASVEPTSSHKLKLPNFTSLVFRRRKTSSPEKQRSTPIKVRQADPSPLDHYVVEEGSFKCNADGCNHPPFRILNEVKYHFMAVHGLVAYACPVRGCGVDIRTEEQFWKHVENTPEGGLKSVRMHGNMRETWIRESTRENMDQRLWYGANELLMRCTDWHGEGKQIVHAPDVDEAPPAPAEEPHTPVRRTLDIQLLAPETGLSRKRQHSVSPQSKPGHKKHRVGAKDKENVEESSFVESEGG